MMRFKVDESVHPDAAQLLRQHGYDAVTVGEEALRGSPDAALADIVRREARTLLTLDRGFGDIRRYPPHEYHGRILFRLRHQRRTEVLGVVARLIPLLSRFDPDQSLWVVDERSVRMRPARPFPTQADD